MPSSSTESTGLIVERLLAENATLRADRAAQDAEIAVLRRNLEAVGQQLAKALTRTAPLPRVIAQHGPFLPEEWDLVGTIG